jgi:D-alanyl-D-alanine carboxypeptidase (penicillin-binding protein 5/6)
MMTAMVVIDNTTDFSQKIKVDARTIHQAALKEASVAGFLPSEEVTLLDLLYGMMLPSGAEASSALARSIAGSEAEFVRMMNDEADRLGMKHTHFANASGLHDADHYTTAEDLSLLLNYALNNETFRQIFTTQKHTTEPTNLHPEGYTLLSTLFTKIDDNRLEGGRLIGGKTGYTSEAGLCLASLAKKDGHEYILITMGATGDHRSAQAPIQDAFTIYNTFTS